jgi:hypothetical protein
MNQTCTFIALKLEELYPETKTFLNFESDWQLLFAVILSAQATDVSVNEATAKLFVNFPKLEDYTQERREEIHACIKKVGLGKSKTEYLIKTAKILLEQYDGHVPTDRLELQKLPGVGYKTSGVVLAEYYNYPYIPVDTHVLRVTHRLGIVPESYDPTKTENKLEKIFDVPSFIHLHRQFILLGRNICTARSEKCEICPLRDVCRYFKKKK